MSTSKSQKEQNKLLFVDEEIQISNLEQNPHPKQPTTHGAKQKNQNGGTDS